ncbi:MAG TPA: fibronectin type III domain-containing protein [Acidimicrobiales bacterium]|nr:fibronectin type III domain-containing protein [Acidimicrobiales bacterium]
MLLASAVVLGTGAFGATFMVGAPSASAATLTSDEYTIGSPSGGGNGVSVTPTVTGSGASDVTYTLTFTATGVLTSGGSVTLVPSASLGSVPANGSLTDLTSATCFQLGFNGGSVGATSISFRLIGSCSVASGDRLQVSFTATAPGSSTPTYDFIVTTSADVTTLSSNSITNELPPPTLAASNALSGELAIYTISQFGAADGGIAGATSTLVLQSGLAGASTSAIQTIAWYNGGGLGYTVTYTPSGGAATADTVTGATVSGATNCTPSSSPPVLTGCNVVTLTLGAAIPAGATVTIRGAGTNPIASSNTVSITPSSSGTSTGDTETTNSVSFGSVVGVTVTVSPALANATATYVVSFTAGTAMAAGTGSITVAQPGTGFAGVTGVLVTDGDAGWDFFANSPPDLVSGTNTLTVRNFTKAVGAADELTMTIAGVTNPGPGTYSDFTLKTAATSLPATATAYVIGATGAAGIVVAPNPEGVSALSTYTVSNLFARTALAAGSSTIEITANTTSTILPGSAASYAVTDITTPSGSGTVLAVSGYTGTEITVTFPNAIAAGDELLLTIADVFNPSTASSTNTMTFTGSLATAAVPGAPTGLTAGPGDAQVALNWTAPLKPGGSAIASYNIYEGTSSGGETLLENSGSTATSILVTGLTNGTEYYFEVTAVNGVGEGPVSNEASATPSAPRVETTTTTTSPPAPTNTGLTNTATRLSPGPCLTVVGGRTLGAGQRLCAYQWLRSVGGRYRLVMQADGNLVVYSGRHVVWNSRTEGDPGAYLVMQADGNLVVYGTGEWLWASRHEKGHPSRR